MQYADVEKPLEYEIKNLDGWLANLILKELMDEQLQENRNMPKFSREYQRALKTAFGIEKAKPEAVEEIAKSALILLAESEEYASRIAALIYNHDRLRNKGFIQTATVIMLAIMVLQTSVEAKWDDTEEKYSVHVVKQSMNSKHIIELVKMLVGSRDLPNR